MNQMTSLVNETDFLIKAFYKKPIISEFQLKKEIFLESLKSPTGKTKYKRYQEGTPLRYAGGKTLAVGLIVELLPDNLQQIVSMKLTNCFMKYMDLMRKK